MGGTGVIDRFLEVFTSYIDSGFGLLGSEVSFLAATLAAIDVTLAALPFDKRRHGMILGMGAAAPPSRLLPENQRATRPNT